MVRKARNIRRYDEEKLLEHQNIQRQRYGLKPLKTLQIENLIYLQTDKKEDTALRTYHQNTGGMYQ
jgi:hypothetical protein